MNWQLFNTVSLQFPEERALEYSQAPQPSILRAGARVSIVSAENSRSPLAPHVAPSQVTLPPATPARRGRGTKRSGRPGGPALAAVGRLLHNRCGWSFFTWQGRL